MRNGQRETSILCAGVGMFYGDIGQVRVMGGLECHESGFEPKGHVWTSDDSKLGKDKPDVHF